MTINLTHLKKLTENKVPYTITMYASTMRSLESIAETEKIRISDLIRDLLNQFIDDYKKSTK
jgi:hypothetical protein